ncbi:MAG: hypothetical protein KDA84_20270 [Planctomycetaceae bacterium]|nr:hypothetical protein [Planctomycetaceae bacterium]
MPIDLEMKHHFKKCGSCGKTFRVEKVRPQKEPPPSKFPSFSPSDISLPSFRFSRKWILILALTPLVCYGVYWGVGLIPDLMDTALYGTETSELREWYHQFEPGMSLQKAESLLNDIPIPGELTPVGPRESIYALGGGDPIRSPPGTENITSTAQGAHFQLEQDEFVDTIGGRFREARWRLKFRLNPEEEIGSKQLYLVFTYPRNAKTPQLKYKQKSGF